MTPKGHFEINWPLGLDIKYLKVHFLEDIFFFAPTKFKTVPPGLVVFYKMCNFTSMPPTVRCKYVIL